MLMFGSVPPVVLKNVIYDSGDDEKKNDEKEGDLFIVHALLTVFYLLLLF